jgi:glutathione synthase/RimK-type ligase-like ATP-grasp enzyme
MTITLGFSRASMPSALRIAEASGGKITAVQGNGDINWGRRTSTGLNSDISNAVNKRAMRELFSEHGVPSPQLYDEAMARCWLESHEGGALIGRPDFHTRCRGFWVIKNLDDLDRALRGTRRKMAATHFIRYIATTEAPKEFRIHVFKGKSIRISQKKYQDDDRKDYMTVKPDPDLPKRYLRHAATSAVDALGLDFGTVDLLANDDQTQTWVLEVNCAPGLGGSMPRVWAQTFISYMEGEWNVDA